MTRQTVDELYDDAQRLNDEVADAMRQWQEDHPESPWGVEYEIPAETNGWVYYGDSGGALQAAYWADVFPAPNRAVAVSVHPTHPRDESRDYAEVAYIADMDEKLDSKTVLTRIEGEPYRTPLHVRKRMFWEAVEYAIEWMENSPPVE